MQNKILRVLLVGDIVGRPGRRCCQRLIPVLKERENLDFIIANAENAAGGSGITGDTANEIFGAGVDVLTTGDHAFKQQESFDYFKNEKRLLRPANYSAESPGHGAELYETESGEKIGVINLLGRVFLDPVDSPFKVAEEEINKLRRETKIIFVDIHAEATSEKIAMGWYLDGLVTGVFGTHTHVQTADEQILPKGTAFVTDVGMTGPHKSVLGREIQSVLKRFVTDLPSRFGVAKEDIKLCGALVEVDAVSGKAVSIRRLQESVKL